MRCRSSVSLLLVVLVCGCGDDPFTDSGGKGGEVKPAKAPDIAPQVQMMEDLAEATGKFCAVLEGIDGEDSAKAAVPKLESLLKEMREISAKVVHVQDLSALLEDKRFMAASGEFNRLGLQIGKQAQRLVGIPSVSPVIRSVMLSYGEWAIDLGTKLEAKLAGASQSAGRSSGPETLTVKVNDLPAKDYKKFVELGTDLKKRSGASRESSSATDGVGTITISPVRNFDELLAYIKGSHKVTSVDMKSGVITIDASRGF